MAPTVGDLTEGELIARIQAHLLPPPDWLLVGIGDDAAVVEPARNRLEVLSVDGLVEGVHFDRGFTPPHAVGHRALAVNLSDLAAMGAEPRLALLSLALPPALSCSEFDEIIGGLAALASRHRLHLVGGNLTRSPGPLMIDLTVTGSVKRREVLTRGGARPGDEIYVSGSIGAAAAGLQMLHANKTAGRDVTANDRGHRSIQNEEPFPPVTPVFSVVEICTQRYLYPEPRVRLGLLLGRNRAPSACMDLSDGLADAAHQLAAASGVGMVIDRESLPIEPCARDWFQARGNDPVTEAITGGDDYELLFTLRPAHRGRLRTASRHVDVPIARIGICTKDQRVVMRRSGDPSNDTPIPRGFRHFA